MVFLIDILHPAHVHFFRCLRAALIRKGHRVIVTAREKEMSIRLLDAYAIEHTMISRQRRGAGLIWEMIYRTARLLRICIKERPALLMGIMGPSIAVTGFLLRIKAWVFYDTENAWITNWFAYPLAARIYSPECYQSKRRRNQLLYAGYHELAYLHPARFTPDKTIPARYGIEADKPYYIIRFVGWLASHDLGEKGLTVTQKREIVTRLESHGTVYISSEAPLPPDLDKKALKCPIEMVHHIMAFACMVVGESATMASEAAVMGVPAFFISDTGRGYTTEEEQRYGLVRNFTTRQLDNAIAAIEAMSAHQKLASDMRAARQKLLTDKIDVTGHILSEIQKEFPGSSCAE